MASENNGALFSSARLLDRGKRASNVARYEVGTAELLADLVGRLLGLIGKTFDFRAAGRCNGADSGTMMSMSRCGPSRASSDPLQQMPGLSI
jgi:hypothetical protein